MLAHAAQRSAAAPATRFTGVVVPRPAPTVTRTRRVAALPLELLAAAGDVDAPIAVPIVAALVVTVAVTAAVPAFLNRGQDAAEKIFSAKEKNPLDSKKRKTSKR